MCRAHPMLALPPHCHPGGGVFTPQFQFPPRQNGPRKRAGCGRTGRPCKEASWCPSELGPAQPHAVQYPSRLCSLCSPPLLQLSSFTLALGPAGPVDSHSHGSLRGSPEYLVPFSRQGYGGPVTLEATA